MESGPENASTISPTKFLTKHPMNFFKSNLFGTSYQPSIPTALSPTYRPSYLVALLEAPREDVEELGGSDRSKRNPPQDTQRRIPMILEYTEDLRITL